MTSGRRTGRADRPDRIAQASAPDATLLPAGDLIYLKLVGRLARLGRRATVEEVEEFYAPYAPFRGLAATWTAAVA